MSLDTFANHNFREFVVLILKNINVEALLLYTCFVLRHFKPPYRNHCSACLKHTLIAGNSMRASTKSASCAEASAVSLHGNRLLKHKRRFCSFPECTNIVKSQGRCQRHGAMTKKCKIHGCSKQAQGSFDRMCKAHFRVFNGDLRQHSQLSRQVSLSSCEQQRPAIVPSHDIPQYRASFTDPAIQAQTEMEDNATGFLYVSTSKPMDKTSRKVQNLKLKSTPVAHKDSHTFQDFKESASSVYDQNSEPEKVLSTYLKHSTRLREGNGHESESCFSPKMIFEDDGRPNAITSQLIVKEKLSLPIKVDLPIKSEEEQRASLENRWEHSHHVSSSNLDVAKDLQFEKSFQTQGNCDDERLVVSSIQDVDFAGYMIHLGPVTNDANRKFRRETSIESLALHSVDWECHNQDASSIASVLTDDFF